VFSLVRFASIRRLMTGVAFAVVLACGDVGSATPPSHVDVKATYDRQPQLLTRVLGELQQASLGLPQLYFVGFAGFGGQAVFKREVLAVRQLFDERFGTRGRSLALINHESTLSDNPLATVSNLKHVLLHLGRRVMDTKQDTLFLFLTSHGDKGKLTIELPGFTFPQLTPGDLKRMLDDSGIRHRVIVISACHSGSFIRGLANPTTLVITAARSDRSSFGCEDRRRWTYFGDAYFNHALRQDLFIHPRLRASQAVNRPLGSHRESRSVSTTNGWRRGARTDAHGDQDELTRAEIPP
jgi:peptidase C13-like protein